MIGKLTGRLDHKGPDHVLIDVGGVGYVVYVSDRTMAELPSRGEAVSLHTELLVREDLLQLFGFMTPVEREWHRLLTSVQGIGAKASMSILSTLGADGVSRALALGDEKAISSAKGVGPKTAKRVLVELKDKAPGVMAMDGGVVEALGTVQAAPPSAARPDAMSALANLGYAPAEAAAAVAEVEGETPDADAATLIRLALKKLAPKG